MRVIVEDVAFLGAVVRLKVRLGPRAMLVDTFNGGGASLPRRRETIEVGFRRENVIVLDD